jgi:hypothetical protein
LKALVQISSLSLVAVVAVNLPEVAAVEQAATVLLLPNNLISALRIPLRLVLAVRVVSAAPLLQMDRIQYLAPLRR